MRSKLRNTRTRRLAAPLAALIAASGFAPAVHAVDVRICTSRGIVEIELDDRNAPLHAANFARYVESGFYNGTVFHRVVPGSMVQGGGYDLALARRLPGNPVRNESAGALSNRRGTIAASRGEGPDSATSQFFFNLTDNSHLDAAPGAPGYTVFGRVTAGLEVLDEIAALPSRRAGDLEDVPVPLVELESVTTLERTAFFGQSVEDDPATLARQFAAARAAGDAEAVLAAVDALRGGCIALDPEQHVAEAEAALSLGRPDRARYGLEQYLARASTLDPELALAQRLYARLPQAEGSNIDARIAHCQRPAAPSVPGGQFAELATLEAVESAVRLFRQQSEAYLRCVTQLIDSGQLNDAEIIDATKRHNDLVVEMTAVATRFNQAVREFKAARGLE